MMIVIGINGGNTRFQKVGTRIGEAQKEVDREPQRDVK